MNEIEVLIKRIEALLEADERIVELHRNGSLTLAEREAWLRVNEARRDAYSDRIDKLVETQSGTTPILTRQQADALRNAVRQLEVQNIAEAAVRALLDQALTIGETLKSATFKGLNGPKAAPAATAAAVVAKRDYRPLFLGVGLLAVAGTVVLVARSPTPQGGRRS